jgi:hypothetical protein
MSEVHDLHQAGDQRKTGRDEGVHGAHQQATDDTWSSTSSVGALRSGLGVATYESLIRWILGAPMPAQIVATFDLAVFLRSAGA